MYKTMSVKFDDDKSHVWIEGRQYVTLERFLQAKKDTIDELSRLSLECKRLYEENKALKVLLKIDLE